MLCSRMCSSSRPLSSAKSDFISVSMGKISNLILSERLSPPFGFSSSKYALITHRPKATKTTNVAVREAAIPDQSKSDIYEYPSLSRGTVLFCDYCHIYQRLISYLYCKYVRFVYLYTHKKIIFSSFCYGL